MTPYVLGLDLGPSSIGWALLAHDAQGQPCDLLAAGVRIFPAGLEDLDSGKGASPNLKRRAARQRRRQLERRARRRARLFRVLARNGLLPRSGEDFAPTEAQPLGSSLHRQRVMSRLYARLVKSEAERRGISAEEVATKLPYLLRERALREALEPHELGLLLYHLGARRGYQSNRKEPPPPAEGEEEPKKRRSRKAEPAEAEGPGGKGPGAKDREEEGVVLSALKELDAELGGRTLGQLFASKETPQEAIRRRYLGRSMIINEFDRVTDKQTAFGLVSQPIVQEIRKIAFHQRPLKSAAHLIGPCELEPKARRAPMALWSSQRYRLLQAVNNLRIRGRWRKEDRPVDAMKRQILLDHLERHGDLRFSEAKKLLGLEPSDKLNLEGQSALKGNRTTVALRRAFGPEFWDALSPEQKDELVLDLRSIHKREAFQRRLVKLGVAEATARELFSAENAFEDDYLGLSQKAVHKLLPLLEAGTEARTAMELVYPDHFQPREPLDRLPPYGKVMPGLRNPLVGRVLTELRKVVNAILEEWGKPVEIRLELARDLKSNAEERDKAHKKNQQRERERKKLAERIQKECGIPNPKRSDVDKAALWDECKGICPYTGQSIPFASLFGPSPRFDIEHIIPRSRSLDDSFSNKTLCRTDINREVKRNKTPWEAFHGDPERYEAILDRVRKFQGDKRLVEAKLRRFQAEPEEVETLLEKFTERQLVDTRYASREAALFLAHLYGGLWDPERKRKVFASAGQLTALLRSSLDLNGILSPKGSNQKSRDDHRHHAIDAICVALTTPAIIKAMADKANEQETTPARVREERRGWLARLPDPFPDFHERVREVIAQAPVTHRPPRLLAGALHEETHYSPPRQAAGATGEAEERHVRKPLSSITDVEAIVDPAVRAAVQRWIEQGHDLKKIDAQEGPWPVLETRTGRTVPIKAARIKVSAKPEKVGGPGRERWVKLGNNSHAEIVEFTLPNGKKKYEDRVISVKEAWERKRRGEPLFAKEHVDEKGNRGVVKWVIRAGDVLELEVAPGVRELRIVRSVSLAYYQMVRLTDARLKRDIFLSGDVFSIRSAANFNKFGVKHVHLSPLGRRLDGRS